MSFARRFPSSLTTPASEVTARAAYATRHGQVTHQGFGSKVARNPNAANAATGKRTSARQSRNQSGTGCVLVKDFAMACFTPQI